MPGRRNRRRSWNFEHRSDGGHKCETLVKWLSSVMRTVCGWVTTTLGDTLAIVNYQEDYKSYISSVPRFIDTPLSFFDDYEVINGVPVFALRASGCPEAEADRHGPAGARGSTDPECQSPQSSPSLEDSTCGVTHSSFSSDGKRLLTGHMDGTLCIWDTEHGTLLNTRTSERKRAVWACHFLGESSTDVASIDKSCWLVRWNVDNGEVVENPIPNVADQEGADSQQLRVAFSRDGRLVALTHKARWPLTPRRRSLTEVDSTSAIQYVRSRRMLLRVETKKTALLNVFEMDKIETGAQVKEAAKLNVAWTHSISHNLKGICFSDDGRGLLTGLYSSGGGKPGTVIMWPDWRQPEYSISLYGSLGSWSHDGTLVVAWDPFIQRGGSGRGRGACFVWDVAELEKGMRGPVSYRRESQAEKGDDDGDGASVCRKHPIHGSREFSPQYEARKPKFESSQQMLWARFVESSSEKHHLAMCTIPDDDHEGHDVQIQVWLVENNTVVHTVRTGIEWTRLHHDWVRDFAAGDGVETVAMSPCRCWIGLYIEGINEGFICHAMKGVKFLNISLPDKHKGRGYKLSFGGPECKMAMAGSSCVLLWDTGAICGAGAGTGRQMHHYTLPEETATGKLVKQSSSLDWREAWNHAAITQLKFSPKGEKLGIIKKGSPNMHVLDFACQNQLHLKQEAVRWAAFQSFSFSQDGTRLAAAMEDGRVSLWDFEQSAALDRLLSDGIRVSESVQAVKLLGSLPKESALADLPSVLDVAFFKKQEGGDTVVVCDETGLLVWLEAGKRGEFEASGENKPVSKRFMEHNQCYGCQFSAAGTTVALFTASRTQATVAIVVDLVQRTCTRRVEFSCRLRTALVFPQNVASDASVAVAGWKRGTGQPIVALPDEEVNPSGIDGICEQMVISDDGAWVARVCPQGPPDAARGDGQMLHAVATETAGFAIKPLHGTAHAKAIQSGKVLRPEALALSKDGRRIACAGDNEVVVWTPYGTKGCVPDYYSLNVEGQLECMDAFGKALEEHGPSLLNGVDADGWPLLLNAIRHDNVPLVRALLSYRKKKRTRALFSGQARPEATGKDDGGETETSLFGGVTRVRGWLTRGQKGWTRPVTRQAGEESVSASTSALELAVDRRLPEIARMLIRAMHEDLLSRTTLAHISLKTLVHLGKQYPSLFLDAIRGEGVPVTIGKISVPERIFKDNGFVVQTSPKFLDQDFEEFWKDCQAAQDKPEVEKAAFAKVFPYSRCCQVGMDGLLRPLLVYNSIPLEAFSTQLVHSIIAYKWRKYAYQMVIGHATFYLVYVGLFTAFVAVLGHDTAQQELVVEADAPDPLNDWAAKHQAMLLSASAVLGFWNLATEVKQILNDVRDGRDHGFNGMAYWLRSKWNLLDLLSSLMTAVILPATHFTADTEGRDERESMMVAITAILLWWKLLYFATPFRATGPLVVLVFDVLRDIVFFVFLLAAILLGFSLAFFVTFRHDLDDPSNLMEDNDDMMNVTMGNCSIDTNRDICRDNDVNRAFGGYERSLFTTFGMMLGNFENEVFFTKSNKAFPRLLFVVYMAIMMIMMLNLLIALMGAAFARIKETEELTFLKARAAVIDDVESMASRCTRQKIGDSIEDYLHTIVPCDAPDGRKSSPKTRLETTIGEYRQELKGCIVETAEKQYQRLEKELEKFQRLEKEVEEVKAKLAGRSAAV